MPTQIDDLREIAQRTHESLLALLEELRNSERRLLDRVLLETEKSALAQQGLDRLLGVLRDEIEAHEKRIAKLEGLAMKKRISWDKLFAVVLGSASVAFAFFHYVMKWPVNDSVLACALFTAFNLSTYFLDPTKPIRFSPVQFWRNLTAVPPSKDDSRSE